MKFDDVTKDVELPVLAPDYSVNRLFYDANNPGHGLDFGAHTLGFTVFYFGHTLGGERLWLHSELFKGDLEYGVLIELEMYECVDGVFGDPAPPVTSWGTITVSLADCDSGHATFDGFDGQFEMDLKRLTRLPDVGCTQ